MSLPSALPYEPAWVTVDTFSISNPIFCRKTFTHHNHLTNETHTWRLHHSRGSIPPTSYLIIAAMIGILAGLVLAFTITRPFSSLLTPISTALIYLVSTLSLSVLATATVRFAPTRFTFRPLNPHLPTFTLTYDRHRGEFVIFINDDRYAAFSYKLIPFDAAKLPNTLLITLTTGEVLRYFKADAFSGTGYLAIPNATCPIAHLIPNPLHGPRLESPSDSPLPLHPALAASLLYLHAN